MKRIILLTCVAALATGVLADTVIWYRFDDQEPLTRTAAGVYVTNCVANTYPAHPRTIYENVYNDDNETNPNTAYLPTYTNSAPAGYGVYDPVTGTRVANRGCLHFHTTGSGDRNGGMLRVTQDAALNALTNLRLEAFMRLGPDVPITASYMRPIILKANLSTQGTWGLHVFESNLFYRATLLLDDGSTASIGWGNGSRNVRVDDGRWHHLAVTFDFGTKKVYSYVNGKYETDHINDLEYRYRVGGGLGYQWLEGDVFESTGKWSFSQEAGLEYVKERYERDVGGADDNNFAAFRYAHHLKWIPSFVKKNIEVFHNLEYHPDTGDWSNVYTVDADAGISTTVFAGWTLLAKVEWDYNSDPAPSAKKSDIRYILGLGYKW